MKLLRDFKHKKAYICNKKHKKFKPIDHEKRKRFYDRYRFRIDIHARVIII